MAASIPRVNCFDAWEGFAGFSAFELQIAFPDRIQPTKQVGRSPRKMAHHLNGDGIFVQKGRLRTESSVVELSFCGVDIYSLGG